MGSVLIRKLTNKLLAKSRPNLFRRRPGRPPKNREESRVELNSGLRQGSRKAKGTKSTVPSSHGSSQLSESCTLKTVKHRKKRDADLTVKKVRERFGFTQHVTTEFGGGDDDVVYTGTTSTSSGHLLDAMFADGTRNVCWRLTPKVKSLLDKVSVTDVTSDELTVTVKECTTDEGFFAQQD